jgi:hypothetical protein
MACPPAKQWGGVEIANLVENERDSFARTCTELQAGEQGFNLPVAKKVTSIGLRAPVFQHETPAKAVSLDATKCEGQQRRGISAKRLYSKGESTIQQPTFCNVGANFRGEADHFDDQLEDQVNRHTRFPPRDSASPFIGERDHRDSWIVQPRQSHDSL